MIPLILLLACALLSAQNATPAAPAAPPADDYSGMYSFLQDGEFVQLTVEDAGRVTGFISRYGDLESDRGAVSRSFLQAGKARRQQAEFHHRDRAWGLVRIQGHRRTRTREKPGRRSLLRAERHAYSKHHRCQQEDFVEITRSDASSRSRRIWTQLQPSRTESA